MELRHLRYFVTVAEELNFTSAAKVLHISQPPLSQQISQLENELGVVLFERTSRRVAVTQAGQVLLNEARRILANVQQFQQIATGVHGKELGAPLRLASVSSGFSELLPAIIPAFRDLYPNVILFLSSSDPADQVKHLLDGTLDIGILRTDGSSIQGLDLITIETQEFIAVVPEGHRLSTLQRVPVGALSHEELIILPRRLSPNYVDALVAACRAAGFSPRITHQPEDDQVLLGLVACGLGIGLVPECVSPLRLPGTRYLPLEPPAPTTTLCLAQSANRPSAFFGPLADLAATATARMRAGINSP
ncbi:LysR substrate-binding domain-containing protein [Streptomyces sp. NPDC001508]|uniref:LysR substrate-binding domain-containing protein n=1 Tax=Streptomyces sp. NPDC001508 TaxID=3154656 RepID=UPI0033233D77